MKTQAEHPRGFVVFMQSLKCGVTLSDKSAGRVFKAAAWYFMDGIEPENLSCAEQIVFNILRDDIDSSTSKHREVVARNRKIASTRSSRKDASPAVPTDNDTAQAAPTDNDTAQATDSDLPPAYDNDASQIASTRDDSHLIESNQTEANRSKSKQLKSKKESTAAKAPARAFGEYGWVKLTEPQYARLLEDLGEEEALRCIRYVDESAQQTGNKNKWRDWNLVLRKCSREGWGRKKNNDKGGHHANAGQSAERRFAFKYDVD